MDNYSEGLATGMALNQGNHPYCTYPAYGGGDGFGFGGEWGGLIGLLIVASLFGGNGWGFGGNRGNACATQADLAAGFNNSAVLSSLNDIKLGQAQAINYNNQGFSGLNTAILQGFNGVDNAVCTLGYNIQSGFNSLGHQLADCCCTTQRAIDSVKYENAKNTCDIIRAGQDNTRAILDYLTGEKISALQAENSGLKAQISNDRQSAYIIDALAPKCPAPAYVVQPPQQVTFPTNCCGNVAYANYNGGCGC
jgi:hypothetical protein